MLLLLRAGAPLLTLHHDESLGDWTSRREVLEMARCSEARAKGFVNVALTTSGILIHLDDGSGIGQCRIIAAPVDAIP